MTFEELQAQIEKDLSFDETQLDTESLRIPQLHNKYLKHLYSEKLTIKKLRNDMGELLRLKHEYYTGKMDEATLKEKGWEPFLLRVLRSDIDMYLDSDKDIMYKVFKMSKAQGIDAIPRPNKTKDEAEFNRFTILKGQIIAGNNSKELIKEFKTLLVKLIHGGKILRKEGHDLLIDLAALGY